MQHISHVSAGIKDALQLKRVKDVITGDSEVRTQMFKSLIVNTLCLVSILAFDLVLMPLLHRKAAPTSISSSTGLYQIFWVLPVMGGTFYLNGIWYPAIAERIYMLQYGRLHAPHNMRLAPMEATSISRAVFLCTSIFTSYAFLYVPWIGNALSFCFTCWIDSFYCFEFAWRARGLSVEDSIRYLEEHWSYFFGFGLPITTVCFMGNSLMNTALFALLFPIFIVLAMYANPVPSALRSEVLDTNSGDNVVSALFSSVPARLPIFGGILFVQSAIIRGISVLVGKKRGFNLKNRNLHREELEDIRMETGWPNDAQRRSFAARRPRLRAQLHDE